MLRPSISLSILSMHDKKYYVASERNVGLSFKTNNAIAQMMQPGIMTGNMTTDGMMMKPGQDITSSIDLMNIIGQAIGSNVNVSLSDAATTAEGSVGNDPHAVAAHIDEQNGYLVYNVMMIDPSMNFSKIIVDPGNGQILSSKQLSKVEHMMMHGMVCPGMMDWFIIPRS